MTTMIIASIIVLVFGFAASAGFADCSIFSHLKFQPAGFAIKLVFDIYIEFRGVLSVLPTTD
jgi:hypothetical protein